MGDETPAPRDMFVVHSADRDRFALAFADREHRARTGAAEPFEVIEDHDGERYVIRCVRMDDARERYASLSHAFDPITLDHLRDADRIIGEEIDSMARQVHTITMDEDSDLAEQDTRALLTIIEYLADRIGLGDDGEGVHAGPGAVQWALRGPYDADKLADYERLRTRYPNA